jgi:hypothetical protein
MHGWLVMLNVRVGLAAELPCYAVLLTSLLLLLLLLLQDMPGWGDDINLVRARCCCCWHVMLLAAKHTAIAVQTACISH